MVQRLVCEWLACRRVVGTSACVDDLVAVVFVVLIATVDDNRVSALGLRARDPGLCRPMDAIARQRVAVGPRCRRRKPRNSPKKRSVISGRVVRFAIASSSPPPPASRYSETVTDFRSDPMPSAEGKGRARQAWDAYSRTTNKILRPVIDPVLGPSIKSYSANTVADLLGFWLLWQLHGGTPVCESWG